MYRYVAIVWHSNGLGSARMSQILWSALASKNAEWCIAHEGPGLFAMHRKVQSGAAEAHVLNDGQGVILGTLFDRHQESYDVLKPKQLGEQATHKIVASGGRHLVEHYWGSYVAFIYDEARREHHVLREPCGNLPCYRISQDGIDIFFSSIEDCCDFLPVPLSVNREYLARWLVFCGLTARNCGLDGVEDIPGGERLTISEKGADRTSLWDPVEIARNPRFDNADDAARHLRLTVQATVDAWASCYQRIVHKLSGGLDSSIVAACLANTPSTARVSYLHLSLDVGRREDRLHLPGIDKRTADKIRSMTAPGDERHFARLVAERLGTPLLERERTALIDLSRMWQAPLRPSPPMYCGAIDIDDIEIELARTSGAQAYFSGEAGDSVFLATMQPFPAIDFAFMHGMKPDLWSHLSDSSTLSRESIWRVLTKVVRCGLARRPYQSPVILMDQPSLLREEITGDLTLDNFRSVWDKRGQLLPPGKANHVAGVAGSANYNSVFHSSSHADHIDPLNSQPIWELMLQLPTYTVLRRGVSRGLARYAFGELLPAEIRRRQVKGTGTPFYQEMVRRNFPLIRETLSDGLLVKGSFLDRRKLATFLSAEEPFLMVGVTEVMAYMAAEVWLRQWADIAQSAAPRQTLHAVG